MIFQVFPFVDHNTCSVSHFLLGGKFAFLGLLQNTPTELEEENDRNLPPNSGSKNDHNSSRS